MYTMSSFIEHITKNFVLIWISLVLLPLDSFIVVSVLIYHTFVGSSTIQRRRTVLKNASFMPKTILVTGVGMTKGLTLARSFFEAGHTVIGADFQSHGVAGSGSVSRALAKFYPLHTPQSKTRVQSYVEALLKIIIQENVELWVSCSSVASAVEDGEAKEIIEARTKCKAIQFDARTTQMLHEKDTFIKHAEVLNLLVPETHTVKSREEVMSALMQGPSGRKYIMKPIGVDDANRGDMSLLPKSSIEQTKEHINNLKISKKAPWILQQFIQGDEYCTHSLVICGEVLAFVACPSAELLMHYRSIPFNSKLSQNMLEFTKRIAAEGGESFSGHLSFDFIVDEAQGDNPAIYPIECNPRAHTAVVLFSGTRNLADNYVSILRRNQSESLIDKTNAFISTPEQNFSFYWVGHDLLTYLNCILMLLLRKASMTEFNGSTVSLIDYLLFWKDGTMATWDPMPWWWLYHSYWPMQFLGAILSGNQWSRINVSTNKVFRC